MRYAGALLGILLIAAGILLRAAFKPLREIPDAVAYIILGALGVLTACCVLIIIFRKPPVE